LQKTPSIFPGVFTPNSAFPRLAIVKKNSWLSWKGRAIAPFATGSHPLEKQVGHSFSVRFAFDENFLTESFFKSC